MKQIIYLCVLFLCVNATAGGDRSGIEPQSAATAADVSYTPSTPSNWTTSPAAVATALNIIAADFTSLSRGRAAVVNFAVGNSTSISTNNYLGMLNDQSATSTSVSPLIVPCTGTLSGIRAQRTANSTSTAVMQFFKSAGGATVSYSGTGVSCSINTGTKECNAATTASVTIGDMLIVRVTGNAWSTGAGGISTKIFCN